MTGRSRDLDLDLVLGAFLTEGPAEAPDRAIDAALDTIAVLPQRRRSIQLGRFSMPAIARYLLAAALVIVLAVAAAMFAGQRQPTPSPTTSPGATLTSPAVTSSTAPSAAPSVAASTGPSVSAASLSARVVNRVLAAIAAAEGPASLTANEEGRLTAAADGAKQALDDGSTDLARIDLTSLRSQMSALDARLVGPTGAELRRSVEVLEAFLDSTPFGSGPSPAGAHYSVLTGRNVYGLIMPDRTWAKQFEDSEVLALVKGKLTLAFHHTAQGVDEASLLRAIGVSDTTAFSVKPKPVTIGGTYRGLEAQSPAGNTLWYTAGLQAFDPAPGDDVRIWVVDLGSGKPLTIEVTGPPAEIAASLAEIQAMLDSLIAY